MSTGKAAPNETKGRLDGFWFERRIPLFFIIFLKSIKVLELLLSFFPWKHFAMLDCILFRCQENSYEHLLRGKSTSRQLKKALILLDPPYDSGNSYFTWNLFMLRRLQETWPEAVWAWDNTTNPPRFLGGDGCCNATCGL